MVGKPQRQRAGARCRLLRQRRGARRLRSARRAEAEGPMKRLIALLILIAPIANACPVCFGNPDSPMTKGTNNGIAVLLGVVFFVQIGFAAMFWSFWLRARALRRRKESMRVIQGGAL